MYDVEMMRMLTLIHAENAMIFEMIRCIAPIDIKKITFDAYEKEYENILKSLERYGTCSDCSYKNRLEKMMDIVRDKGDKNDSGKE